jgi:signal transduction histidine kinase
MDARTDRHALKQVTSASRLRHLAWPLGVLGLLIPAATATLVFMNRSAIHSVDQADPMGVVIPIGFSLIGALLVSRRSRDKIGWIFLGIGLFGGIEGITNAYVFRSLHVHPLPAVAWVAWLEAWVLWLLYPSGLAVFLFLLFPDGRFQSRRWRRLGWVAATCMTAGVVLNIVQPTIKLTSDSPAVRNPLAVRALAGISGYNSFAWVPVYIGGLGLLVAALVGTILRTRRSTGELRQQLKWLGFAAGVTAGFLVVTIVVGIFVPNLPQGWMDLGLVLGFGVAVPVSCGIAILKHGLYELDVVVSKTVAYGVLAAFITSVYVGIVVGVGAGIGNKRNLGLSILATAVVAVAFQPVRDRVQHFANRLVYGKRATPYEVLSEFSERMSGAYATDDLLPRMARILGEGTGASQSEVWIRVAAELRPGASWPTESSPHGAIPMSDGELPSIDGVDRALPVRHQGELLGALSVTKSRGDPLRPAEEKLMEDLASGAGLVLRNVRLTEELLERLREIQRSRQRIVAAQDEERRRLERNLHDGAQQQLVALQVKLSLAERLAEEDCRVKDQLAGLKAEAGEALENLRDLARGIYPPLLADQGLAAALSSQARKAAIPVSVQAEGISRYPQEQEAAVYFCCLEALQNVAKYAGATRATVQLYEDHGRLTFEVTDDGAGFDTTVTSYGTGLQGMADRLSALGGQLEVRSGPGEGTTVIGLLPVPQVEPVEESSTTVGVSAAPT